MQTPQNQTGPRKLPGRHPVWGSCAMPLDPGKAEVLGHGLGFVCESPACSQKRQPREQQQHLQVFTHAGLWWLFLFPEPSNCLQSTSVLREGEWYLLIKM